MKYSTLSIHIILLLILTTGCYSVTEQPFIAVNLVGYQPHDTKQALLVNNAAESFELVDASDQSVVFEGTVLSVRSPDAATGDATAVIDFSEFSNTGEYFLRIDGEQDVRSEPFKIGNNLYQNAALKTVQSFYYNRCGTGVDNGTRWKHDICHTDDAVFYRDSSKKKDVTGGWHDAGDYGKFTINIALSAKLLLYQYELNSGFFSDGQLNIPENSNGIPDILDEVNWALQWLLKMQAGSGAVYHKVSQKKWVGEFMPDEDPEIRYIFRVSSNATAGFAAVTAAGARMFESADPAFSEQLAKASKKAWRYLKANPEIQPAGGFSNPQDVHGGEYSDKSDLDVRLWAAVELFRMAGNENEYLDYFVSHYEELLSSDLPPLSWKEFHSMAFGIFINTQLPEEYRDHQEKIFKAMKTAGEDILDKQKKDNYETLLDPDEYYWGSASVNLGYAFHLIQLYRKTGMEKYYKSALDQLHYTLGRNPFNQSLLTGIGTKRVQSPYHQFSMEVDTGEPVPGMMVGGPNNHIHLQDREISKYPGKNYRDDEQNYLVNEVAINFTAIFAFIAGFFKSDNQEKNRHKAG